MQKHNTKKIQHYRLNCHHSLLVDLLAITNIHVDCGEKKLLILLHIPVEEKLLLTTKS